MFIPELQLHYIHIDWWDLLFESKRLRYNEHFCSFSFVFFFRQKFIFHHFICGLKNPFQNKWATNGCERASVIWFAIIMVLRTFYEKLMLKTENWTKLHLYGKMNELNTKQAIKGLRSFRNLKNQNQKFRFGSEQIYNMLFWRKSFRFFLLWIIRIWQRKKTDYD